MTSKEFEEAYGYDIRNNPIVKRIHDAKPKKVQMLIDFAFYFEEYYDVERAYITTAFTPHDFKHHIISVMNIAGQLLDGMAERFDVDDLFCFMLACILHDIAMIHYPEEFRKYHSYKAAEMIGDLIQEKKPVNEFYEEMTTLVNNKNNKVEVEKPEDLEMMSQRVKEQLDKCSITSQQRKKIAVMVLGHSDLKLKEKTIHTLDREAYNKLSIKGFSKIHSLAAFLRWADELDLSETRRQGILENDLPDSSKEFWEKLYLVQDVDINPGRISLTIHSDRFDELKEKYEKDKTGKKHPCQLINEILDKVNKEKDTCNNVFADCDVTKLTLPNVDIERNQEWLNKELHAYNNPEIPSAKVPLVEGASGDMKDIPDDKLNVEALQQKIKDAIEERHLLKEGHYCLHTEEEEGIERAFCMRNPLDCNGLLSIHAIFDDVSEALLMQVYDVKTKRKEDFLLVGIANSGAMIAAHMAAISGIPFVSLVPNNKEPKYTDPEKEIDDIMTKDPSKKVILVIGVNCTGKAISDACKKIKNIEWVVGLIDRDLRKGPEATEQLLDSLGVKHYFLIKGYRIDECQYSTEPEKCPYGRICEKHPIKQEQQGQ